MANLQAVIRGDRVRSNSTARSTRLSDRVTNVHANTWHTFSEVEMRADGSGWARVTREGQTIARMEWEAE